MPSREGQLARWHTLLLTSRAGAWIIALLFFGASAWLGHRLRFLHDEGIFSYDLARVVLDAPLAGFFFVKAKPVTMALLALPARAGYPVFLLAHAALGAVATLLASEAARALGASRPNVAGLLLATSASFVIASANGYPNVEGCLLLSAFLAAYFHERRGLAAAFLGLLPFARNELLPVSLVFAAYDFHRRRDPRFVIGACVLPLLYVLGGALYHHDPWWLVRKFPNPQGMPSALKVYAAPTPAEALRSLRAGLLAASPALAALALFAPTARLRGTWPLWLSAAAIYGAMTVFQVAGVLGFDTSPRYYVAPLGLLAVLAATAVSPPAAMGANDDATAIPRPLPYLAAPAVLVACSLQGPSAALAAGVGVVATILALIAQRARLAESVLVAGAILGVTLSVGDPEQVEARQHARAHRLFAALRRAGIYQGQPLFTDLYAVRFDRDLAVGPVHVLVNDAIAWELRFDANPANGQYAAMEGALGRQALSFHPETHAVRRDAVYVIRRLERTARWRELVERASPQQANDDDFVIYWWNDPGSAARLPAAP